MNVTTNNIIEVNLSIKKPISNFTLYKTHHKYNVFSNSFISEHESKYKTFIENKVDINTMPVVIICANLLLIILQFNPTNKELINGEKTIIKIYLFKISTIYPFNIFILLTLTVPLFLKIITNIARPIAASTAATVSIKKTNTCPV